MFDLATVITSRTRLEVLTLFIRNPALELGIRETARRLDANPMLVRHELLLLQAAGLLKSRRVANSIQFSLDSECSAVEPLRSLLDSNDGSSPQGETAQSENDSTGKSGASNRAGTPNTSNKTGTSSKAGTQNKGDKAASEMTVAADSEENYDD